MTTQMTTGNALTIKTWDKKGYIDMYKRTAFGRMMSNGTGFYAEELQGAKFGDQTTFNFTGLLTGIGVGEDQTLEGNEESLALSSASMVIGEFFHAVKSPSKRSIQQQRTNVDFEGRARELLPKYMASRVDASIFNQLAGVNTTTIAVDGATYSGNDRTFVQGLNSIIAPSTNRIIRAGGVAADESLTSSNTFTLDLVDAALELISTTNPTVEPILQGGEEVFDWYIPWQGLTDLRRDTTGKIQWYQNALAFAQGGDKSQLLGVGFGPKPVGRYNNVNIIPCNRVAYGQNSSTSAAISTVRRSVLCGRNAFAFGSVVGGRLTDTDVPFEFREQLDDYGRFKGIGAAMMYGVKKLQFSSEDYGSVVISAYAGSHTS